VSLAVFDIDGVVADVRHRLHHLTQRPKNWDAFLSSADQDPPLQTGLALVTELRAVHDIVWLTGRPNWTRDLTSDWLAGHGLPTGPLHMRSSRDFRPARVFKVDLLRGLPGSAVAAFIDDDPEVVAAARAAGFPAVLADWVPRTAALADAQERAGRT
jgi:hypothetical protein